MYFDRERDHKNDSSSRGPYPCGSWGEDPSRKGYGHRVRYLNTPPKVPLLRALWSLLDGIKGALKGSWGVLGTSNVQGPLF